MRCNGILSTERSFRPMDSWTTNSAFGSTLRWRRSLISEDTLVGSFIWRWVPMVRQWPALQQMKLWGSGRCSNQLKIRKDLLSYPSDRRETLQRSKRIKLARKCAKGVPLILSWLTIHRSFKHRLHSSTGLAWDEGFINFNWRTLRPHTHAQPFLVNEAQLLNLYLPSASHSHSHSLLITRNSPCLPGLAWDSVLMAILRSCELEIFIETFKC